MALDWVAAGVAPAVGSNDAINQAGITPVIPWSSATWALSHNDVNRFAYLYQTGWNQTRIEKEQKGLARPSPLTF